jgi:hypothetical protein
MIDPFYVKGMINLSLVPVPNLKQAVISTHASLLLKVCLCLCVRKKLHSIISHPSILLCSAKLW